MFAFILTLEFKLKPLIDQEDTGVASLATPPSQRFALIKATSVMTGARADSPGYLARLRQQGWAPHVAAQPLQNEPLAVLPTGNVSNPSM